MKKIPIILLSIAFLQSQAFSQTLGFSSFATTAFAASVASAAASTETAGFNASIGIEAQGTQSTHKDDTVSNAGSLISGTNGVTLKAKNNMAQVGSAITSDNGDITYDIGKNLVITSAKDTYNSKDASQHFEMSASVGTAGVSANASYSNSGSNYSEISNQNSKTEALNGKVTYKVGGDMLSSGHNSTSKQLEVDVAGKLRVESVQDSAYGTNRSMNLSGGYGSSSSERGR